MQRKERIALTAAAYAQDEFMLMLNPAYRGPKFDFSYKNLERRVESHLYISTPYANITTAEVRAAQCVARRVWDMCVSTSGVLEWIGSQSKPKE